MTEMDRTVANPTGLSFTDGNDAMDGIHHYAKELCIVMRRYPKEEGAFCSSICPGCNDSHARFVFFGLIALQKAAYCLLLEIFSAEGVSIESKTAKWTRFVECTLDTMRYHCSNVEVLCKGTAALAALTEVGRPVYSGAEENVAPLGIKIKGGTSTACRGFVMALNVS
jgi:hypothetical protein